MVTVDGLLGFLATAIILMWVLSGSVYAILQPYLENVDWTCLENLQYTITNPASCKSISFHVKLLSIRFREGTVTLNNSQRRGTAESSLKLVVVVDAAKVIVNELEDVEVDVSKKGVNHGGSIKRSIARSISKHFWRSPTINRIASFLLRRIVVELTDTSIVLEGLCTIIAPESILTQSRVFLGADGGDIELDAGSEEHGKNLVMSKRLYTVQAEKSA